MKVNEKKILTQHGQAFVNLIWGIAMVLLPIATTIRKHFNSNTNGIFYRSMNMLAAFCALLLILYTSGLKKQPEDELSQSLMLKATATAAYVEIFAVAALSTGMLVTGILRNDETFSVTSFDVLNLAMFLCGVYHIARNAIFLWLDRTPKECDEEEE